MPDADQEHHRRVLHKPVLTTGEVARLCHVAPRTVSKWFDSGQLPGYRIPGSGDRRIPLAQLITFMRDHRMPMDGIDGGTCRVLLIDHHAACGLAEALNETGHYDVQIASTAFEAGAIAERFRPQVIVLHVTVGDGQAAEVCRAIKHNKAFAGAHVIATGTGLNATRYEWLLDEGFDACLEKPYSPSELIGAIEVATDLSR
ncbi:MAG: helix-turn-helix domain-containing protein [Phycisphaerae bacterium]|nr:helix-turn-helix domain-containing protein [Phycisphaerae bacterium]